MSDRRDLRSNGRVAHESLRGRVKAERFVAGAPHCVTARVAAVLDAPDGRRERELIFGQTFTVLDTQDGHAFGFCARDGYVGWVSTLRLAPQGAPPTHAVHVRQSHAKATPQLKSRDEVMLLCHGARLHVRGIEGAWAEVDMPGPDGAAPLYVPAAHIAPLSVTAADPVAVAALYLGTPYLWGGNSSLGIDCSGLVQAACLACGLPCPGDSDQQEAALGTLLPAGAPPRRGDLLFWKGHVAWVADPGAILHANAYHMAVAQEPLEAALARIAAQGEGQVRAHRRLGPIG
ncbi:NLP/P60 hydrolase [Roseovarius spongiae]|uniref:NLP/P60 hydrolase n=1 Tax=Roseovarius spongiae TaxID=2320272 RepID=A0A3A8AVK2_9RHOB|nr:NlpC/P60 family protein [Roseovarius spongiae]RKF16308.1 NLP/P60 hydrolase [Roseovarius spongiae]